MVSAVVVPMKSAMDGDLDGYAAMINNSLCLDIEHEVVGIAFEVSSHIFLFIYAKPNITTSTFTVKFYKKL